MTTAIAEGLVELRKRRVLATTPEERDRLTKQIEKILKYIEDQKKDIEANRDKALEIKHPPYLYNEGYQRRRVFVNSNCEVVLR